MTRFNGKRLAEDELGLTISIELLLVSTIAVIGMLVALTAVRDAITSEVSDVARAVQNTVQSYAFFGVQGHSASTAGSDFIDNGDHCNRGFRDRNNRITNCIQVNINSLADEGDGITP